MAQAERTRAPGSLVDVRARMAAWDRSFVAGHGRHPDKREWAGAARVVGGLGLDEADALAEATYAAYGPGAPGAPAHPDFEDFAQQVMALRTRRDVGSETRAAAPNLGAWPVVARGRAVPPEPTPLVRAAAPLVLAGLALACWVAHARGSRLAA